jgi:hypothetical protein
MNKTVKKITIIGLVLVTVFFLYRTFMPKSNITNIPETKNGLTVSTSDAKASSDASIKKENIQELLALLLSINNVKLSNTLFSRVEFTSLKDFSVADTEQRLDDSMGRSNPFLPIGDESNGEYVTAVTSTSVGTIQTNPVTSTTLSAGLLVGENTFSDTLEQYFEWGTVATPPFTNKTPSIVKGTSATFTYSLTKLTPNTTYYYRAVVKTKDGKITTGNTQSFKTPKL